MRPERLSCTQIVPVLTRSYKSRSVILILIPAFTLNEELGKPSIFACEMILFYAI